MHGEIPLDAADSENVTDQVAAYFKLDVNTPLLGWTLKRPLSAPPLMEYSGVSKSTSVAVMVSTDVWFSDTLVEDAEVMTGSSF